jgi:hypothetical protein
MRRAGRRLDSQIWIAKVAVGQFVSLPEVEHERFAAQQLSRTRKTCAHNGRATATRVSTYGQGSIFGSFAKGPQLNGYDV